MAKVRTGEIALPRFQRFEAWTPSLIEDALTNVLRSLPIGSTLVLGVGNEVPFVARAIVTAPEDGERITELLLDGQQRITALWRSLNDTYPSGTCLVCLPKGTEEDREPYVVWQTRWAKGGIRYPLWVDDPVDCWSRRFIPLRLLNPESELEYKEWAKEASNGDSDTEIEIRDIIADLRAKVANYSIPFMYLEPTTPKEVAIEVFIKLNTRYVKLTAFDIVVAQMEEATGGSLHDLTDSLNGRVPDLRNFVDPSDLVLPAAALLQDRPPNQRGYLGLDFKKVVNDWDSIVRGAKELVAFLRDERIPDGDRLPTEAVLAPLAALWAEAEGTPDELGNLRILLRKYLWRSFFTTRYDRAVPTAVLQDYRALRKAMRGELEEKDIPCFDETAFSLPSEDLLLEARWPKYQDRLARAILLLSFRGGAEDIADGATISSANIRSREYHHLYPVAWLESKGISEDLASRALNCIMITWKTNRTVSAKEPLKYLLERAEASRLGEAEIRRRLKTHFVPYDLLAAGDYEAFMSERATACRRAIQSLCDGSAWNP